MRRRSRRVDNAQPLEGTIAPATGSLQSDFSKMGPTATHFER